MSDETELTPENEELSKARARLEKVVKDNRAIEQSLIEQGVAPKYEVIMMMKLDLLATFMLGSGVERFEYEIEAGMRIKDILMQIQQQVASARKPQLLVPDQNIAVPTIKGI